MDTNKIKISDLKRADYNPRIMPDSEMASLKTSIQTFGFVEPVVVNSNSERFGVLVGGHQRLAAVESLMAGGFVPKGIVSLFAGDKVIDAVIPCSFVDLTLEQEKALNLALNKIKGKWDEKKLIEIIFELKDSPIIPASGFRDDEISRILDSQLEDEEDTGAEVDLKEPRSK